MFLEGVPRPDLRLTIDCLAHLPICSFAYLLICSFAHLPICFFADLNFYIT